MEPPSSSLTGSEGVLVLPQEAEHLEAELLRVEVLKTKKKGNVV